MTPSILRRNNRPAVLRGAIAPSAGLYPSGAATNAGPHTIRASTSRLLTEGPSSAGVGGFGLVLTANNVQTDVARMGELFTQAARDLGVPAVFEQGWVEPTFRRDNTGTFFWTLPVRVNSLVDSDALKRAMARAIFWSSTFTKNVALGEPHQIDKQSSDGGASILNAINAHGAFSITPREGAFGAAPQGGVAPGSVPGNSTPPPGPVGGDSIVPIGGPGQMSTADLLASFCNKRPKDSEAALTPRDRQEFQAALTRLGFSTQGIDGVIGGNTRTAVQSFQRSRNITTQGQPGYGTIGPQTQAAIIAAVCQGLGATVPQPQPTTPAPTMPLPNQPPQTTTPTQPATPTSPRPTTPTAPQTAQPLANTQPPVEAGMGAGPMLLLAAAGAAAVFLYTKSAKKNKGARS